MANTQPKNPNRIEKINSLLQQLVGEALQEYLYGNPGLVTVSRVETTRDLKWAKVWVSIVGGDDDQILNAIKKNIYDIQGEINRNLPTKPVPRLQFFLDTTPRYAQHIDELIKQIHEEDNESNE